MVSPSGWLSELPKTKAGTNSMRRFKNDFAWIKDCTAFKLSQSGVSSQSEWTPQGSVESVSQQWHTALHVASQCILRGKELVQCG
jgi:hypothetical protein